MNLAPFSFPSLVADIVLPLPVPPPPPNLLPGHLFGSGLASLGFWMLSAVAAAALWWLRRRRSMTPEGPSEVEPG